MTDVTSGVQTALAASPYLPARFVTLTLPDYTVYLWSGVGTKVYNGNTYEGAGALGSINPITEKAATPAGIDSQRLQLSLSGLDTRLAQEARNYLHPGSTVEIVEAMLDATGAIISDAYDVFVGEVDTMPFVLGETLTISLICENFMSFAFRGPNGRYRTANDQQEIFPNSGSPDLGLQYNANLLPDIPWGVKSSITRKVGGTSAGSSAAVPQPVTS